MLVDVMSGSSWEYRVGPWIGLAFGAQDTWEKKTEQWTTWWKKSIKIKT